MPMSIAPGRKLRPPLHPGANRPSISFPFSAAAALLLLIVGAWLITRPGKQPDNFFATAETDTLSQITLQTGDGSRFSLLPGTQRTVSLKDATVNLYADSLQVTGTGKSTEWATLFVPGTKSYKIILPDGSEAWLDAQSKLKFPSSFNGALREVYVTGEAFFKVVKNPSQPFIVHTYKPAIRVLGTQFNINAYDTAHIITSLVEAAPYMRPSATSSPSQTSV